MNRDSIYDSAESLMKHYGDQARDELSFRLVSGKTVGRCNLRDLLDCELNGDRYKIVLEEIMDAMMGDCGERAAKCDQFINGLIERYLDSKPELVEEMAAEIAEEE